MSVSYDFSGKVILITGSSNGIGATAAIMFAKSGADVVINGRNAHNVSEVAQKCLKESEYRTQVLEVVADITKEADIERLVQSTIAKFGKLDVLVNNAGIGNTGVQVTDPGYPDHFQKLIETNLNGPVHLTKLCVQYLAKTKGNVVNLSTIITQMVVQHYSANSMSKGALDMFTKCMAAELGPKMIRVNSIVVGMVRTPCFSGIFSSHEQVQLFCHEYGKRSPVGRIGQPEDIANTILFLASDAASFITGANVVNDGGHLAASLSVVIT